MCPSRTPQSSSHSSRPEDRVRLELLTCDPAEDRLARCGGVERGHAGMRSGPGLAWLPERAVCTREQAGRRGVEGGPAPAGRWSTSGRRVARSLLVLDERARVKSAVRSTSLISMRRACDRELLECTIHHLTFRLARRSSMALRKNLRTSRGRNLVGRDPELEQALERRAPRLEAGGASGAAAERCPVSRSC